MTNLTHPSDSHSPQPASTIDKRRISDTDGDSFDFTDDDFRFFDSPGQGKINHEVSIRSLNALAWNPPAENDVRELVLHFDTRTPLHCFRSCHLPLPVFESLVLQAEPGYAYVRLDDVLQLITLAPSRRIAVIEIIPC